LEYLILFLFIFLSSLFLLHRNKQKKLAYQVNQKRQTIEEAVYIFNSYLNLQNYFNHRKQVLWNEKYKPVFESLPQQVLSLPLQKEFTKIIKSFNDYFSNAEKYRLEYNNKFIVNEIKLNKHLFDSIEKYPLTEKQREAIVSDEDNNLIIAGAGTGKTSTLLGKIIYLLNPRKVKPDKILVLAFTRKASEEIKERVRTKTNVEMDIKTFHKFGLNIITSVKETSARRKVWDTSYCLTH
jgi:DNA helicase-4